MQLLLHLFPRAKIASLKKRKTKRRNKNSEEESEKSLLSQNKLSKYFSPSKYNKNFAKLDHESSILDSSQVPTQYNSFRLPSFIFVKCMADRKSSKALLVIESLKKILLQVNLNFKNTNGTLEKLSLIY